MNFFSSIFFGLILFWFVCDENYACRLSVFPIEDFSSDLSPSCTSFLARHYHSFFDVGGASSTSAPPLPFVNRVKAIRQMCISFEANDRWIRDLSEFSSVPSSTQFYGSGKTYLAKHAQERVRALAPEEAGLPPKLHQAFCDALYVRMDLQRAPACSLSFKLN